MSYILYQILYNLGAVQVLRNHLWGGGYNLQGKGSSLGIIEFTNSRIKKIPYQAPPTQLGPQKCAFWKNAF